MGLDQNFYSTTEEVQPYIMPNHKKNIQDYRNHWQIQLYLDSLFKERGGEGDFSCINLELSKEDLLCLLETIKAFSLPKMGNIYYDIYLTEEEYDKIKDEKELESKRRREKQSWVEDINMVNECLNEIEKGNKIFYRSWW